ncbi:MAG: TolC family protein [Bacteroidota bacterium]
MRRILIFPVVMLWFLGNYFTVSAQADKRFDPLREDIATKIPPLHVLQDSALATNHYIQFRNLQIVVNYCKLKASQLDWTRNIGIQANVGYGNLYDYSMNNSSGGTTPSTIATSRNETKYSTALYLNMPINTIVGRKNQIKLAKTEIEQAEQMAGVQRDETRQLVIRQYNDLILKQRLLRIKSKSLETGKINLQMVEKEFANGVVSVTEYARITDIVAKAEADYESARMDFLTTYMVLEEIVGMQFHLNSQ